MNGWRRIVPFVGVLAVLGGLGSTWIYAMVGFRPELPPLKLISELFSALGF